MRRLLLVAVALLAGLAACERVLGIEDATLGVDAMVAPDAGRDAGVDASPDAPPAAPDAGVDAS